MQRQLTLDLGTPPPATFDNFFAAGNHELIARLRELEGALAAGPVADRTFYIWGEAGQRPQPSAAGARATRRTATGAF